MLSAPGPVTNAHFGKRLGRGGVILIQLGGADDLLRPDQISVDIDFHAPAGIGPTGVEIERVERDGDPVIRTEGRGHIEVIAQAVSPPANARSTDSSLAATVPTGV